MEGYWSYINNAPVEKLERKLMMGHAADHTYSPHVTSIIVANAWTFEEGINVYVCLDPYMNWTEQSPIHEPGYVSPSMTTAHISRAEINTNSTYFGPAW